MNWSVGKDNIHRMTIGNRVAEISLCDMRSRWRVTIYQEGIQVYRSTKPYIQMQRARKAAELLLKRELV